MHSVRLEPPKLILIVTRTIYQATGDAGVTSVMRVSYYELYSAARHHWNITKSLHILHEEYDMVGRLDVQGLFVEYLFVGRA